MCLYVVSSVLCCPLRCWVHAVGELMSNLCCLCLFACSCVVFFLCIVCQMLPVSLDCPFLIAHFAFSNVYLYRNIIIYMFFN